MRPTTGRSSTRPANWRPSLSSTNNGFDSVPAVTAAVALSMPAFAWAWMPVSQRNALTSGTPCWNDGLPSE